MTDLIDFGIMEYYTGIKMNELYIATDNGGILWSQLAK